MTKKYLFQYAIAMACAFMLGSAFILGTSHLTPYNSYYLGWAGMGIGIAHLAAAVLFTFVIFFDAGQGGGDDITD